mmetsp:Transcript_113196/g.283374  ORF Transcript_113196/g.283374 Transcript_113196/m.283374 type:complete len:204 (+) Transcript_113196:189-800(+)
MRRRTRREQCLSKRRLNFNSTNDCLHCPAPRRGSHEETARWITRWSSGGALSAPLTPCVPLLPPARPQGSRRRPFRIPASPRGNASAAVGPPRQLPEWRRRGGATNAAHGRPSSAGAHSASWPRRRREAPPKWGRRPTPHPYPRPLARTNGPAPQQDASRRPSACATALRAPRRAKCEWEYRAAKGRASLRAPLPRGDEGGAG